MVKRILDWKKTLFVVSALIAGLALGVFTDRMLLQEKCGSDFKFINRGLQCHEVYKIKKYEYLGLKNSVLSYLDKEKADGRLLDAAVYFRDLENGPIMGINEYIEFVPASLLKLPLLLTYLRIAEDRSEVLDQKLIHHHGDENPLLSQAFPSNDTIQEEAPYTVNDLLHRLIAHSDNQVFLMLVNYVAQISPDRDLRRETLVDFGIIDPKGDLDDAITVKSYASIFRALYNVSFLGTKEMSEKALSWLADADFTQGLVAGVPDGTVVAHKFGERFGFSGDQKQLHDCGIVYFPGNPYLLCVMTRGSDFTALADIIKNISRMVYDEVNSRRL